MNLFDLIFTFSEKQRIKIAAKLAKVWIAKYPFSYVSAAFAIATEKLAFNIDLDLNFRLTYDSSTMFVYFFHFFFFKATSGLPVR